MSKSTVLILANLLALSALFLLGCSEPEPEIKSVRFVAGYKAQANLPLVAVYAAQEMGYFEDQGLEVDIQHSIGESMNLLMGGEADFVSADAGYTLKLRADPGLPIVAIALFGQRGQQAFIALSDLGIIEPRDWEDKTFGYKGTVPPEYLAIVNSAQVDRSKIQEVRVGYDPRVLTEGQVDLLAVFKSNEPNIVRGLGFDVVAFDAADYGMETMGLTYVTREDFVDENPETAKRFLKATMKGMEYAFANTEEALDMVLKYAEGEDRDHMRYMMLEEKKDATSPLTDQNGFGWMTAEQWQSFHDSLLEYEGLPNEVDVNSVFTDRFLQEIYEDGILQWP